MYQLIFMTQAQKDAKNLVSSGLKPKAMKLLETIQVNPLQYPPAFEYLQGNMKGLISRRINKQHRLVYEVFETEKMKLLDPRVRGIFIAPSLIALHEV